MPVVFRHELAGQRAAAWAQPALPQEGARLFDHFRTTALHDARRFGGDWQTGVLFQRVFQERGSRSVQAMASQAVAGGVVTDPHVVVSGGGVLLRGSMLGVHNITRQFEQAMNSV
jgi:hypothetical protein